MANEQSWTSRSVDAGLVGLSGGIDRCGAARWSCEEGFLAAARRRQEAGREAGRAAHGARHRRECGPSRR